MAALALLCDVLVAPAPVAADHVEAIPEVLTLKEAAHLLRIEPRELEALARRKEVPARRIGTRWRFNRETLLAWLNGDWQLISRAVPPSAAPGAATQQTIPNDATPLAPGDLSRLTGAGTTLAQDSPPLSESAPAPEEEPIGEAPEESTAEEVFLRGQRVLLAPGEVTIDVGMFYAESDNQQLVLADNNIGLATIESETFTAFLLARYGLFEETEIFASATYRDQDSEVFPASAGITGFSRSELGEVRIGVRRTLQHEAVGRPDVIVSLDGRIPTHDEQSLYALGGGIALVKSIDPVVLFASTNYRHTFSRDFDDVTLLEHEDRIDATFGYAYALNDTITLSTALSCLFLLETEFNNATLRQQELFSLQFGLTSWLAKGLYIEPTVSFGLNGPSDSFVVGVTLPYTF